MNNLTEQFIAKGIVTQTDYDAYIEINEQDIPFYRYIINKKIADEVVVLKFFAAELDLEYLSAINDEDIDYNFLEFLQIHYLKKYNILILPDSQSEVKFISNDPFNFAVINDILHLKQFNTYKFALCPGKEIISAINKAYGQADHGADDIIQDLDQDKDEILSELEGSSDLLDQVSDAPIIKLVNHILSQAVKKRASDIHIEPYQSELLVRFRVDGVLYDFISLSQRIHPFIVSRIKIMADLDIAEKRMPQDGRIEVKIGNREVDLRVSSLPTAFGERIVMRLLEKDMKILQLGELGLSQVNLNFFKQLVRISHGIVLVTGPTGSGKTTTLYSALNHINSSDKNILTIEDPIEYQMDGIGQMQVNAKIDLTFARGLRTMVRQDPDVILVGEIRDQETAEIAIQAALTGHLVFSTLHTNDAPSAITRLIDMGVEPFLVSSAVRAIIAQRLVRILCPHCKQEYTPESFELDQIRDGLTNSDNLKIYKPQGCEYCAQSGYRGRNGIFEFLPMSESIQSLLLKTSDANVIREKALQEGMVNLRQDGIRKIEQGLTSIDEVVRVTLL